MVPSWISDRNHFSSFLSTSHPEASYQVRSVGHFGSGEEAKNKLLRWQPWWPPWIFNQNDFRYFDLLVTPMLPIKFRDNRPFVSGEEVKNRFSRWQPSWISHWNNFSYFLYTS